MAHRAAIPLGPAGLVVVVGLLIDPLVVLNVKPEMLLDTLFDVKRNWPVLFTLGCNASATGCDPVGWFTGAVNTPVVVLI
jgi:hypothetical protein